MTDYILLINFKRDIVFTSREWLRPGNDIRSAYPPNAGKNLPWRIQFKSHPPLWRVHKLGSAKVKKDNLRKQIEKSAKITSYTL